MVNGWIEACNVYRQQKGYKGKLPTKGTKEYDEIKSIQATLTGNTTGKGLIKDTFEKGLDTIANTVERNVKPSKKNKPLESGEHHSKKIGYEDGSLTYQNYNYLGPNTQVAKRLARGDRGINNLDEAARQHDIDYTYELRRKLREGLLTKEDVRKADDIFLKKVDKFRHEDPLTAKVTKTAFKAKKIAEDTGILPISAFFDETTTGEGLASKKKGRPKKGGGLKIV
jgi:hypothetical protein